MSLLMDALKRAEESKQDASKAFTTPPPADAEALALEPLPAAPARPAGNGLPELSDHIAALDADLAATAQEISEPGRQAKKAPPAAAQPSSATKPTASPLEAEDRQAIRNAFAAKHPPAPPRRGLWLLLAFIALAIVAIGGYIWYQLQSIPGSTLVRPANAPAPRHAQTALPPAAPASSQSPAAPLSAPAPTPPAASPERFPTSAPAPAPRSEPRSYDGEDEAPRQAAATPIRLTRSKPETDPYVAQGYRHLQAGLLDQARSQYEQALLHDTKNLDALLGLAAIAQRQGRKADAYAFYQQAYEADPKDAGAQAALVSASSSADPIAAESRLKTLLASQPESGPLNFSLGNLYARQNRWAEAQPAYFTAVSADPDNPDYLFNLAVSLDQLRQARPAAQHYRLALEAAEKRPADFDRERVKKRLTQLPP